MKPLPRFLSYMAVAGALTVPSFAEDSLARKLSEQLAFQPVTIAVPSVRAIPVEPPVFLRMGGGVLGGRMRLPPPGRVLPNRPLQRPASLLPADPTPLLCQAYLGYTSVRVFVLKPELIWPGYFPNEASVKELFSLLVEGLEPEDDVWYPQFGDQANPNAYRSVVGFVPDVLIEFSGETSLTVEVDLRRYHAIIRLGDKWGGYTLDKFCCRSIESTLEQMGPGQLCSFGDVEGKP